MGVVERHDLAICRLAYLATWQWDKFPAAAFFLINHLCYPYTNKSSFLSLDIRQSRAANAVWVAEDLIGQLSALIFKQSGVARRPPAEYGLILRSAISPYPKPTHLG